MKPLRPILALALLVCGLPLTALAAAPVAASFSTAVPVGAQSALQLQGSDADGTALVYATTSSPAHGTISNLNTSTGALVYTPSASYTGADSFTYTVTSGGQTSAAGTVTISVTAAKTRVIDTFTRPDGSPMQGKVSFFLTQVASSPMGTIPAKASVSCQLTPAGQCDVSLYPSRAVSPVQYYQVWLDEAATRNTQLLGLYDIPASTTAISLAGHKVTDANLTAQYVFATKAEVDALTQAVATATINAQLLGNSPANNALQKYDSGTGKLSNAGVSDDGTTITHARNTNVTGNVNATGIVTASGYNGITVANVPALDASKVTAGTFDANRIPSLDASKIGAGTLPDARIASAATWNAKQAALGFTPLNPASNLSDVAAVATARANLGLGTLASQSAGNVNVTGGTLSNITCTNCTNVGSATSGAFAATGDEVINYDSDANGSGVFRVQRGGVDKLVAQNDGKVDVPGGFSAATRAALTSARVVYASTNGAALNSNLTTGGGTDDTAAIQALLDQASGGTPVHVIVDGPALVGALNIYSNTTLECLRGGGFYLKSGTNRALLRNAHPMGSGTPTDHDITLRGCVFEGNPAGQVGVGALNRREANGTLIGLVQLYGVDIPKIQNCTFNHSKSIGLHLSNATNVYFEDLQFDIATPGEYQQGGIQIQGNSAHVNAHSLRIRSRDTGFALNGDDPDYVEPPFTGLGPYVSKGPIEDVNIFGLDVRDAFSAVSLFSSTSRHDRIYASNITGDVTDYVFTTLQGGQLKPGNVGTVEINGVNVRISGTPYGGPSGVFGFYGAMETAILRNISIGPLRAGGQPPVYVDPSGRIKTLIIDGLFLSDSTESIGDAPIRIAGKVARLQGSNWHWPHSSALEREEQFVRITNAGGQVGEFTLNGVTTSRVRNIFLHDTGQLGTVQMSGVRMVDAGGGAALQQSSTKSIEDLVVSNFWGENASPWLPNGGGYSWNPRGDAFPADTTAPAFVGAATSAGSYVIRVTFSEGMNSGNYARGATVTVNGVPATFTEAMRRPESQLTIEYVLSAAVPAGATVTWAYNSSTGATSDAAGNPLPTIAAQAVTNAGTVKVFDRFTASNGTANAGRSPSHVIPGGNTWTTQMGDSSTVQVAGNRLQLTDTNLSGSEKRALIDSTTADGTISFDVEPDTVLDDTGFVSVLFRVQDSSNYWTFRTETHGLAVLYKVTAGVASLVASTPLDTVLGRRYTYSVTLSGNSIACKRQGATILSATDSYLNTQTKHGVSAYKGTFYFDEFRVTVP